MNRNSAVFLPAIALLLSQLACSSGNQANVPANTATVNAAAEAPANTATQPAVNNANAGAQANANTNNDPFPELVMLYSQLFTARMKGDKAKLEGLLADDYKETTGDGKVMTKAQTLATVSEAQKATPYSLDDLKSTVNGDTGTVTGKVTIMGQGQTETWQVNETFSKKAGNWQAVTSRITDYKKSASQTTPPQTPPQNPIQKQPMKP
ncbi:MAG: hypothetical protein QOF02_3539 [Blastocatellia bacterium]|jgi:hypothetical protein|nr:hypothetical protein [Blastocatellia bacterium]